MAIAAFLSSFLSRVQLQLALSRFQVVLDLNQLLEQKLCSIFHFLHFEIGGNHFLCFFNCFFSHLFLLKRIAIVDWLFLLKFEDFGLDFGSNEFDFLCDSALLDCDWVILGINIEWMHEMMFKLENLFFKLLIFESDSLASAPESIILLGSDRSGIGCLLFDLSEMHGIEDFVVLNEGLEVDVVLKFS